ncbi:hypothetical protein F53441_12543 [Fusarium austroafricanum]|uniref:Nephrocystin 3-like N-terminal domain-containing protein n=1 Tax=Fusarium austroafricanum TaxID=2364996 RepID=A0A8H4JXF3_9HYPO|nr:hypothetical protein F53441_12543 [Fusarium austroafricanum]
MSDASSLWVKSRERLPDDVKKWLESIEQDAQPGLTATQQIDWLINQTEQKKTELENARRPWVMETKSHTWDLRKYFDRMVHWLDKFKGIGDMASSFDPVHAALPWAAFRFVLQAIVAEKEYTESLFELLLLIPQFVISGHVLEAVYINENANLEDSNGGTDLGQQCVNSLSEELVKLYSSLLAALEYAYSAFILKKGKRKVLAIFNSSEPAGVLNGLKSQHKQVLDCGHDCGKILAHTSSHKYLSLLNEVKISIGHLEDRVLEALVRISEQDRLSTLGKISAILFRGHHEEIKRKRTRGTCEWILKKEKFLQWEGNDAALMVLYGNPGAGKTFLISKVVDYCCENARHDEAVAYFYCKREEATRRNPQDILRSILRQLSTPVKQMESGKIHEALKGLPDRLEASGMTLDIPTCQRLIGVLMGDYSRTTIILDALDECKRETRVELMKAISSLLNENSRSRIFISSRTDDDIRRNFQDKPILEIQATDNEADINSFVQDELSQDPRWDGLNPELQQQIEGIFHDKSQGMFQWAALQVKQLCQSTVWNQSSIKAHISNAPKGLRAAYNVIWEQILQRTFHEEQQARRVFKWVLCAFEPLGTAELSRVLQIDPDSDEIEPTEQLTKEDILGIGGNLLIYDEELGVWRFCHLSAREYIEDNHYSMLEAHRHAATTCLRLLLKSPTLEAQDPRNIEPHEPYLRHLAKDLGRGSSSTWDHNLEDYITCEVLHHAGQADSPSNENKQLACLLREFFGSINQESPAFLTWKHSSLALLKRRSYKPTYYISPHLLAVRSRSSTLEIAAIFGLFHMLKAWWNELGSGPRDGADEGPSLLSLAIEFRHERIWRFLLKNDVKAGSCCLNPLKVAIRADYMPAFDALIEAGLDVNEVDRNSPLAKLLQRVSDPKVDTPLKAALSWSTNENGKVFLQKLIGEGANVSLETVEFAVQYSSDEDLLRMLLDANTQALDPTHLLHLSLINRRKDLVSFFVDQGADINKRVEGCTALTKALTHFDLSPLRSLLDLGATIDLSYRQDREAIVGSRWTGHAMEILRCLLSAGMDLHANDGKDSLLRSVLDEPYYGDDDYKDLVHWTVDKGADINQILPQSALPTLLATAAANDETNKVQLLLDAGADPSLSVNIGFGSALIAAAFSGQYQACRLLLDQEGVDVNQHHHGFFLNALFSTIAGHLDYLTMDREDRKYGIWDLESRLGYTPEPPKHRAVIQVLFEKGLHPYLPIYESLEALTPFLCIGIDRYTIGECRFIDNGGHQSYLSRSWFFIMWELHTTSISKGHFHSLLGQWHFPGGLAQRSRVFAKVKWFFENRPGYVMIISIQDDYSQLTVLRIHNKISTWLKYEFKEPRWKHYSPNEFGSIEFTQDPIPCTKDDALNPEAIPSLGSLQTTSRDQHRGLVFWLIFSVIIGSLAYILCLAKGLH